MVAISFGIFFIQETYFRFCQIKNTKEIMHLSKRFLRFDCQLTSIPPLVKIVILKKIYNFGPISGMEKNL